MSPGKVLKKGGIKMDIKPVWDVLESTPLRSLSGQDTFQLADGNMKNVGGDIHTTVDINPTSPTFGEAHSTLTLPGGIKDHF